MKTILMIFLSFHPYLATVFCCSVSLNNDQRRNLGSIAKILQAAAMKKGFGDEAPHLVELNSYIVASHDKFKQFFMECCRVPEPVSH